MKHSNKQKKQPLNPKVRVRAKTVVNPKWRKLIRLHYFLGENHLYGLAGLFFAIVLGVTPQIANSPGDYTPVDTTVVQCDFTDCDYFDAPGNWSGYSTLLNDGIAVAPLTRGLSGWVMDYYKEYNLGFVVKFEFTPLGEQINTVVRYDGIELIIGEAVNSRVALKYSGNYIAPEGYETKHFNLKENIKTGEPVEISVHFGLPNKEGVVEVKVLGLSFTNTEGIVKSREDIPAFGIKLIGDFQHLVSSPGVGLTDWQRTGEVSARFQEFLVQKDL